MRVSIDQANSSLNFSIELEEGDTTGPFRNPAGAQRIHELTGSSFYVVMPDGFNLKDTHSDLLGLGLIVLLDVFVGEKLQLDRGVSQALHDAYYKATGKKILPIDDNLESRTAPSDSRPALAYSGGVDSTAAMAIMPDDTAAVFVDRTEREGQLYNKTAAHQSCQALRDVGKTVYMAETDLEYIISPHTFAHPLAPGLPAIFAADYFKFNTIAFGNILENIYGLTSNSFSAKTASLMFDSVFAAANLEASHVTAGLTEHATAKIVAESEYDGLAQSCMYGESLGEICLDCMKCFRTVLQDDIRQRSEAKSADIDNIMHSTAAEQSFGKMPLIMQSSYMYLTQKTHSNHPMVKLLRKKIGATHRNTSWMDHYYKPALELVHQKYRKTIEKNISNHIPPMDKNQERILESWNVAKQTKNPIRRFWHEYFWVKYEDVYEKVRLFFEQEELEIKAGEKVPVRVYKKRFFKNIEVTGDVVWGSSNGKIAYCKEGVVKAKQTGEVRITATYKDSKKSFIVTVTE